MPLVTHGYLFACDSWSLLTVAQACRLALAKRCRSRAPTCPRVRRAPPARRRSSILPACRDPLVAPAGGCCAPHNTRCHDSVPRQGLSAVTLANPVFPMAGGLTRHPHAARSKGGMGGSPPSHGVGWILGCSPDANGAMMHAAERHRRHPKVSASNL